MRKHARVTVIVLVVLSHKDSVGIQRVIEKLERKTGGKSEGSNWGNDV